jgi:hypothetical protein
MKTTPLPSVEDRVKTICSCRKGSMDDKQYEATVEYNLTQDRDQAYTRLVEGIEEMKPHVRTVPPSDKQSIEAVCFVQVGYEQCKKDILENVVKPLYGKQ